MDEATKAQIATQIDAIGAQAQILLTQLQVLRHVVGLGTPTPAAPSLPATCRDVPAVACARQSEDAREERAVFGYPHAYRCRGCDEVFNGPEE